MRGTNTSPPPMNIAKAYLYYGAQPAAVLWANTENQTSKRKIKWQESLEVILKDLHPRRTGPTGARQTKKLTPQEILSWIKLAGKAGDVIAPIIQSISEYEATPDPAARIAREEEAAVAKAGTGSRTTFGGPEASRGLRASEQAKVKKMTIGADKRASAQSKMTSGESVRWSPQEVIVALQAAINTTANPLSGKKVSQPAAQRIAMMQNREGRPFTHKELIDYAVEYIEPERVSERRAIEEPEAAKIQAERERQFKEKAAERQTYVTAARSGLYKKALREAGAGQAAAPPEPTQEESDLQGFIEGEPQPRGARKTPGMGEADPIDTPGYHPGFGAVMPDAPAAPAQPGTYEPGTEEVLDFEKVSFTETPEEAGTRAADIQETIDIERKQRVPSYEPESRERITEEQADFDEVIKRYNIQVSEPAKKELKKIYEEEARAAGTAAPSLKKMANILALASVADTLEKQSAVLKVAKGALTPIRATSLMSLAFGPSQQQEETRLVKWMGAIRAGFPKPRGRRSEEQDKLTRARRLLVEKKTRLFGQPKASTGAQKAARIRRELGKRRVANREYLEAKKDVVKAYKTDEAAATRSKTKAVNSMNYNSQLAAAVVGKNPCGGRDPKTGKCINAPAKPAANKSSLPAKVTAYKNQMQSWRTDMRAWRRKVDKYNDRVRKKKSAKAKAATAAAQVKALQKKINAIRKERKEEIAKLNQAHKAAARRHRKK